MNKILGNLRYGAFVAVVSAFIGAALMLYAGTVKVYKAIAGYLSGKGNVINPGTASETVIKHLSNEDAAIARIIESMDAFLISIVLMYLAYGIYALFCDKDNRLADYVPASIVPKNIGQLKETLAQLILVVLIVLFTRNVWLNLDDLKWEALILPASIMLIALALKLADFSKERN